MPNSIGNIIVRGFSGTLDDIVMFRQRAANVEENGDWLYKSTLSNATLAGSKITAFAKDLPGNSGSPEFSL